LGPSREESFIPCGQKIRPSKRDKVCVTRRWALRKRNPRTKTGVLVKTHKIGNFKSKTKRRRHRLKESTASQEGPHTKKLEGETSLQKKKEKERSGGKGVNQPRKKKKVWT